jgi:hypothetical protein
MALFSVAAGRMTIYPWDYDNPGDELPGDESLLWPTLSLDVTAPSNQVVLILRQASTCIPGTISNPSSLGILPPVWASSEVDGTNYTTSACSDRDGHYCLPALPGLWTVQIYDGWLNDFGIQSLTPRDVIVPMSDQAPPLDLVLARLIGDFREARLKNPVMLQNGGLRLELSGQASLSWRVERSHNLIDWTPFALETTVNGSFVIEDAMAASDPTTFYRAVWIR